MAAQDKPLVRAQNTPAPQYFNKDMDQFEYIEGRNGANSFIQLGTVAMEAWQGSVDSVQSFGSNRYGFSIANDGANDVTFTINAQTRTVKSGETYSALFEPFTSVTITATSAYRAEVLR